MLLTFFNWSVHFYFRWIGAENMASENARLVNDLKQKITQPLRAIDIYKGTSKIKVEPKNILIAKIDFGIVRIYCSNGESGSFQGTLTQLKTLLPTYFFFQVTRDTIVHREVIKSFSSSTFGKIQLIVNERNNTPSSYTVSRPKASVFRKWYNSNSA
jgi:DNA-binding LytR/AlgR family response regulator